MNSSLVARSNALAAADMSGLDTSGLRAGFRRGLADVLRELGNLANIPVPPDREGAKASLVRSVLREVLSTKVWRERGLRLPQNLHVASGGFTWIVKVRLGEVELAMSVPKGQANDYDERLKVRVAMSQLVPGGIGFKLPRVIRTYEEPFHACLMSFVSGGNCYALAFNEAGNPTLEVRDTVKGNAVFEQLGFMAAGFSSVTGRHFGTLTERSTFGTARDFIEPQLAGIREKLLTRPDSFFSGIGMSREVIERVLSWVERDCQSSHIPTLVHSDLSPWNLLYDSAARSWGITDGDDSFWGIKEQQLGVCLIGMRGNLNREWVEKLLDGYERRGSVDRGAFLLAGSAYGLVSASLQQIINPFGRDHVAVVAGAAKFAAPLIQIFQELS